MKPDRCPACGATFLDPPSGAPARCPAGHVVDLPTSIQIPEPGQGTPSHRISRRQLEALWESARRFQPPGLTVEPWGDDLTRWRVSVRVQPGNVLLRARQLSVLRSVAVDPDRPAEVIALDEPAAGVRPPLRLIYLVEVAPTPSVVKAPPG